MVNVFVANSPQPILSMIYYTYNGLLTCFLLAVEWNGFARSRKGLRVTTSRHGLQRSSYTLQLPESGRSRSWDSVLFCTGSARKASFSSASRWPTKEAATSRSAKQSPAPTPPLQSSAQSALALQCSALPLSPAGAHSARQRCPSSDPARPPSPPAATCPWSNRLQALPPPRPRTGIHTPPRTPIPPGTHTPISAT